jgi:hypothetical protein
MKVYKYDEANKIISEFMKKEDDYKSIDKLIDVWKQISGKLWRMEGFIFEFSFDHDEVSGVDLTSNWQAQGLGGYADAINYDCSHYDDDNMEMTVQERALILTAKVIAYEINKDFSSDFESVVEYSGLSKEFIEKNTPYIDYTSFKTISRDNPEYLKSLIIENQLPPHLMEYALENLGLYNKTDEVFELLLKYTKSIISRVRRGAYYGIYFFKEEKELISLFKDLRIKEKSYYNHYEIDRHLKNLERYKEENKNEKK